MSTIQNPPGATWSHAASTWLGQLEAALGDTSDAALSNLLQADCYWRDALALTWTLQTHVGAEQVSRRLRTSAREAGFRRLRLDEDMPAPRRVSRVGTEVLELFYRFETDAGVGQGVARLVPDPGATDRWLAWTLLTALDQIKGHEEAIGRHRPTGQSHSRDFRGPNWLDKRRLSQAYADRDPTVLVVGGGQAGLAAAARLTQLGLDTLIIDGNARIGDNWRNRYHALTLHNQVQVNHLPYMPFPPSWPSYIPKDKLANWFEAYVDAMELNFWTSTSLVGATYDEASQRWQARLHTADGSTRTMCPRHIVMATGVSGIPNLPELPTLDRFGGKVMHSSAYRDGEDWAGKRAIVIGSGNSGHDITQDLHSSGAQVAMVQRSPTLVVSIEPGAQLPYALYDEGPSVQACDLLTVGMPLPLVRRAHQHFTARARELDDELLEGLARVGFRLDFGEDGTGWQFKYLSRGGGYYFNVGCSDLLIDGQVGLYQYDQIDQFTPTGVQWADGSHQPLDLVVLATGYQAQENLVERLFGPQVRDRVGPIWGYGDGLELRNMYVPTGQPGLWFIAGSLAQCRINSKYLALRIKADELGLT